MSDNPDNFEKKSIVFENSHSAEMLRIKQPIEAPEILKALEIQKANASILICGSTTPFKSRLRNRLIDLLSRGVAQAALDHEAIVIDTGTRAGVSELVGQGVADRGRKTKLIGVVSKWKMSNPDEPVAEDVKSLDSNHTHFVVTEEEWPGWQTDIMCQLADAVTDADSNNKKRILNLLVGGKLRGSALDASLETVRREWPLIVIEGSGPLADKIVRIKKFQQTTAKRTGKVWNWIYRIPWLNQLTRLQATDPRLFEIISDGNIKIIGKESDASQLRKLIEGILTEPRKEDVLWTAWQRFAEYDLNSSRHRDQWRSLKNWPLYLGAISTLIVLIYSATDANLAVEGAQSSIWVNAYSMFMDWLSGIKSNPVLDLIFRFIIILLPITTSLLLAIETRLKLGSKYILLRGAAEAIKRGIYSLRTLRGIDETAIIDKRLPFNERSLAEHLSRIGKLLLESDVNEAAFKPYTDSIPPNMFGAEAYDDGFSELKPEIYVKIRIGDQLTFYTSRTNQYEKRIRSLQIWMLVWGGVGTFLAAVGAQYWLPFTAAIVSAMTAFLEYRQLEQILTKYNLTKSSLENIKSNWLALQTTELNDEQRQKNIQNLVRDVEATLESENQGWVQYVSQAQEQKEQIAEETEGAPTIEGESAG